MRFSRAFTVLQNAISSRAFPGATSAVTYHGKLVALKALGQFTYDPESPAVIPASIFDIASVSKVVATTSMAMLLYQRGLLDLDMPVTAIVPEFIADDSRRREVTLRMLLAHSSGLPAYEKLFQRCRTRDELLSQAFTTPLISEPGVKAEYSDIGFIILGTALERLVEESLDRFAQREVFGPLGMSETAFNPPASWRDSIVPTVDDQSFRHRIIQGEVQDENAGILGGVAGHAGVFSTVEDSGNVCQRNVDWRCAYSATRNHRGLHPSGVGPEKHLTRFGLGYAFSAIPVGQVSFRSCFWPSRIHRHFDLDRSRTPAFDYPAHKSHLAGLLQPIHSTGPSTIS